MSRNRAEKPLAYRNGIALYTKLKAKTKMKVITPRQRKKNATWKEITEAKIAELKGICQWCELYGERFGFNGLEGHHIISRRFNIHTPENCMIVHHFCHQEIEDKQINIALFPTLKLWKLEVGENREER